MTAETRPRVGEDGRDEPGSSLDSTRCTSGQGVIRIDEVDLGTINGLHSLVGELPGAWEAVTQAEYDRLIFTWYFRLPADLPSDARLLQNLPGVKLAHHKAGDTITWPSMDEDGLWFKPDSSIAAAGELPSADDLVELPSSWVEMLTRTDLDAPVTLGVNDGDVGMLLTGDDLCPAVYAESARWPGHFGSATSSQDLFDYLRAHLALGEQGHSGTARLVEIGYDNFIYSHAVDERADAETRWCEAEARAIAHVQANRTPGELRHCCGGAAVAGTRVTAEHRKLLHEHAVTDAVIDSGVVQSTPEGVGFVWNDGTGLAPVVMFDRDKRPAGRDGKPMKVRFPSAADGGSELGPNVLRLDPASDRTVVVEGLKQQLAFLSWAPPGWDVIGMNGVRGVHKGNVARCTWAVGQTVVVMPDADYRSNPAVNAGAENTASLLRAAGAASVAIAASPGVGSDGIDDVLARTPAGERTALLQRVLDEALNTRPKRTQAILDAALDSNDLDALPEPVPLIPGALNVGEYVLLSGKFGTYKSFVALAWAFALATGTTWGVQTVSEPRPVIYVAAEGTSGLRKRLRALIRSTGVRPAEGMLTVIARPVRLAVPEEVDGLRELAQRLRPGLIVADTWHRMTPGIEENSATDTAVPMDAALSLRDDYGATVLVVHHTGHAGQRSRGSSALEDDADAAWVIKLGTGADEEDRGPDTPRTLEHRKSKDGELAQPARLVLTVDEQGDAVVSVDRFAAPVVRGKRGRPADPGRADAVAAIVAAMDADGLAVSTGYKVSMKWATADGRGLNRVSESLVKDAIGVRRERATDDGDGPDDPDVLTSCGNPPRGGLPPQQAGEGGCDNASDLPHPLSPAQTPLAEGDAVSRDRTSAAADDEGAAVVTAAAGGPR